MLLAEVAVLRAQIGMESKVKMHQKVMEEIRVQDILESQVTLELEVMVIVTQRPERMGTPMVVAVAALKDI